MHDVFLALSAIVALSLLIFYGTYWNKKRQTSGPWFPVPFFGGAFALFRDADRFWKTQYAYGDVSANVLLGKFCLFVREPQWVKKIMKSTKDGTFRIIAEPFDGGLFGSDNLFGRHGAEHLTLRSFLSSALTTNLLCDLFHRNRYTFLEHFSEVPGQPFDVRDLAQPTTRSFSQRMFLGQIEEAERSRLNGWFEDFNDALFSLPLTIPGYKTAFAKGKQAAASIRLYLYDLLERKMRFWDDKDLEGSHVEDFSTPNDLGLVDYMIVELIKIEPEEGNRNKALQDLSSHVFDMMYAAQDASASSLCWAMYFLGKRSDLRHRIKIEIDSFVKETGMTSHWDVKLKESDWDSIPSLKHFSTEVLRYRPPAPFLPHVAERDVQLTESLFVEKGTVVFPSLFHVCHHRGFTNPDAFDPDRFSEERNEMKGNAEYFLPFGYGSHLCLGKNYAVAFLRRFLFHFVACCYHISFVVPNEDDRYLRYLLDDVEYDPTSFPMHRLLHLRLSTG